MSISWCWGRGWQGVGAGRVASLAVMGSLALIACGPGAGSELEPMDEVIPDEPEVVDEPTATTCPGEGEIELYDEDVNGGVTLAGACYRIHRTLTVDDGTLVIERGSTLVFDQGAGLAVSDRGGLHAEGSEDEPIIMTGFEEIPGYWKGVSFTESMSADNELSHVTIEFAGSSAWTGIETHGGGLFLDGNTGLRLSNSTLRDNAISGVSLSLSGVQDQVDITANNFEGNAVVAYSNTSAARSFASDNSFENNEVQAVRMEGKSFEPLSDDATWVPLGIPYQLTGELRVQSELTIEPGVDIRFESNAGLVFEEGGSLQAIGTKDAWITLAGTSSQRGYWKGLGFMQNSQSSLEFVRVEDGGGRSWTGADDSAASVFVHYGAGDVSIQRCQLRRSAAAALRMQRGPRDELESAPVVSGSLFEDNEIPMVLVAGAVGHISSDVIIQDNDLDAVVIRDYGSAGVTRVNHKQTWPAMPVPYRVESQVLVDAPLTVVAGVTMEFGASTFLHVVGGGTLTMGQIASEPVLLTGVDKVAGNWGGVGIGDFNETTVSNSVHNTVIEYGGGLGFHGGAESHANLFVNRNSSVDLQYVTLRDSEGYGLSVDNGATATGCLEMQYDSNAIDDVLIDATAQAAACTP